MADHRGVSEALGFILVLSIIISTTGIVYVTGFEDLQGARDFEQANNAQRAFDVLRTNVNDIVERGAPSRGTEVKLSDASLYMDDPVTVTVTVAESGNANNNDSVTGTVHPIVYETDNDAIVYSNGAIFRESDGGAAMVAEPHFVVEDDRVLVPVIRTNPRGGSQSLAGDGTVLVRTLSNDDGGIPALVDNPDVDEFNVSVTVETSRTGAWEDYMLEEGFDDCNVGGGEVHCWKDDVDQARGLRFKVTVVFE